MFYTIAQLSELTGLSKVSIYKKLKLKELQDHAFKKQGITYVDEVCLNLIRDSLKFKETVKSDIKSRVSESNVNEEVSADESDSFNIKSDFINQLKGTITILERQLEIKDKQIDGLTLGLHQAQALTNNQQQGQQHIILLEDHLKEFDEKLNSLKNQIQEKTNQENKNSGFFKRIFKSGKI